MNDTQSLTKVYLWVVGGEEMNLSTSELIQGRYQIMSPNIWLDTQPDQLPLIPESFSENLKPYFTLFPKNLYFPYIYSVLNLEEKEVILLENAPIQENGELYPSLEEVYEEGSEVRQLYWLWQIYSLWSTLKELKVATSLLIPENIRVQGWRVRLRELSEDPVPENITITQLAQSWENLVKKAKPSLVSPLTELIDSLISEDVELDLIEKKLNYLLLESASVQPLRVKIASGTDRGVEPTHNEDSYYPTEADLPSEYNEIVSIISSKLMIVCDGIEGHEGGEVASQLAISTIKLQIQALLREISQEPEIMTPNLVKEQLGAIIRIANNMIATRNDEQGREGRKRMGTTLVMALQLPQLVGIAESGAGNSHELYLAYIGDSRAYWLTSQSCIKLTVDHDVTTREVKSGHSTYQKALTNPNGSALTQALGTKEGDQIKITIERFMIEEDGVLLLCSDGLSDNNFLEKQGQKFAQEMLSGKRPLEGIIQSLLREGSAYNGHDNLSVVVGVYGVSNQPPVLVNLEEILPQKIESLVTNSISDLEIEKEGLVLVSAQEKGEILADHTLNAEIISEEELKREKREKSLFNVGSKVIFVTVGSVSLLILMGVVIILIQWLINPQQVEQWRDKIFNKNNTEEVQ